VAKNREHVVHLCLAPELRVGLIKLQAEMEVGDSYALLFLLTKALYQERKINREVYELYTRRYSRKLVPSIEERKLTPSELLEQQKLEEKRCWFEGVKADFFRDHRPLASGKSWREFVLGEAEKYKDILPVASEVLKMG
jgi:hypothetical protein